MPNPKVSFKNRQQIYVHWVQTDNYAETGREFGCSANTVKNIVKGMPEYYMREHESQRQQFVQESWMLARQALRELSKKIPNGSLRDISIAYGIIAQRATNAQFAAEKSAQTQVLIANKQEVVQAPITGDDIAYALREYRKEMGDERSWMKPDYTPLNS